jgi:hypothetical protein
VVVLGAGVLAVVVLGVVVQASCYDNLSKPSPKPLRLIGKPMPSSGV